MRRMKGWTRHELPTSRMAGRANRSPPPNGAPSAIIPLCFGEVKPPVPPTQFRYSLFYIVLMRNSRNGYTFKCCLPGRSSYMYDKNTVKLQRRKPAPVGEYASTPLLADQRVQFPEKRLHVLEVPVDGCKPYVGDFVERFQALHEHLSDCRSSNLTIGVLG